MMDWPILIFNAFVGGFVAFVIWAVAEAHWRERRP
jgi:hypothetical protein